MRRVTVEIAVIVVAIAMFAACEANRTTIPVAQVETGPEAININTAGVEELRRIPNIGETLASKIVKFREKHGRFRRVEHLLVIDGISDRRFRDIRHLVRVE